MSNSIKWAARIGLLMLKEGYSREAAERVVEEEQVAEGLSRIQALPGKCDSQPRPVKQVVADAEAVVESLLSSGLDPMALPYYQNGHADPSKQVAKKQLVKSGLMSDARFLKAWQLLLDDLRIKHMRS